MRGLDAEFRRLFAADFALRFTYQMGKTPLLPIFAASIGAGEALIGLVVAASTATGMATKPLFGFLSDRWGRRGLLLAACGLFAGMPLLYPFVAQPGELLVLRQAHGLATAILGPVGLACVAAMGAEDRGVRLAWFGMSRSGAYLLAPAGAGAALALVDPVELYPFLCLGGLAAVVPVLGLRSGRGAAAATQPPRFAIHARRAAAAALRAPGIWLAGGLEMALYVASYAAKAFVPLFVLSQPGGGAAMAGAFFFIQELAHLALRPVGGALADRRGYGAAIAVGAATSGCGLAMLGGLEGAALFASAIAVGAGQGLMLPAAAALVGAAVGAANIGAAMGFYGALRNAGKVAGPLVGGVLLVWLDYPNAFLLLGAGLAGCGALGALAPWRAGPGGWRIAGRGGRSA